MIFFEMMLTIAAAFVIGGFGIIVGTFLFCCAVSCVRNLKEGEKNEQRKAD